MNTDGTGEINLSNNPAYDRWPASTPDGRIDFSSNRRGIPSKGQLYLINDDGTQLKILTDPAESFTQQSISSDGKYIYCQQNIEPSEHEFGNIVQIVLSPILKK
jgi:TolB protein